MNIKIKVLLFCSLFILILTPITEATTQNRFGTYQNCYIESSGKVMNRFSLGLFKLEDKAFIILSIIEYDHDAITSILDEEEGNLLWQEQGAHSVLILCFRGNYSYIKDVQNESTFLALNGLSLIVRI